MSKAAKKEKQVTHTVSKDSGYLYSMSHAPRINADASLGQILPIIIFSSIVIWIVRMYAYTRPMGQFFWTRQTDATAITDFFSYYKMVVIVFCAVLALLVLLYKVVTQSLAIKRCYAYIPMAVYALFVLLSYLFSDYKEFAWFGWNDRFEGALPLLAYMIVLFFVINSIQTERNIKMVLYPLAASTTLLSFLGISQALGRDFFQTSVGQKLLVKNAELQSGLTTWESIDAAAAKGEQFFRFTFQHNEIYQTVYNINYVSFYLTLLVPLFGMLFILSINKGSEEKLWKKAGLGALFALLIYNLIGSDSSSGLLGIGVVGIAGLIILNKKLLKWLKPLAILFIITGLIAGITTERWMPEITNAVSGVLGSSDEQETTEPSDASEAAPASLKPTIDYIVTNETSIDLSINGNPLTIRVLTDENAAQASVSIVDGEGKTIPFRQIEEQTGVYQLEDTRFAPYLVFTHTEIGNDEYIILNTQNTQWYFLIKDNQIYYRNNAGKTLPLRDVEHYGFADNPNFGSWRGYIWSRSFPLLKDTFFVGTGPDTYCIVFPQDDYAGKYSTSPKNKRDIIVDKPHNMYLNMAIGTGWFSLLAMLALFGVYIVQSIRLFRKSTFENDFMTFAGAGIFFGILGFLTAGIVNDSSVSVMPLFYTLLGMGISINMILKSKS